MVSPRQIMSRQELTCRYVVQAPNAFWARAVQGARPAPESKMTSERMARRRIELLQAAEQVQETQLPHQPGRLDDDAAVHLRDPGPPIDEHDRNLLDAEAPLPAAERHLDLEPVALRPHPIEPDALERAAAEALEPAGGVGDG